MEDNKKKGLGQFLFDLKNKLNLKFRDKTTESTDSSSGPPGIPQKEDVPQLIELLDRINKSNVPSNPEQVNKAVSKFGFSTGVFNKSMRDKVIFIVISYFARSMSLLICSYMIYNDFIKKEYTVAYSYVIFYTAILIAFAAFVNLTSYSNRAIFNYFNANTNYGIIMNIVITLIGMTYLTTGIIYRYISVYEDASLTTIGDSDKELTEYEKYELDNYLTSASLATFVLSSSVALFT